MALTQVSKDGVKADLIDGTKIADDAINSEHYVDGSIDTAHIAADQITGALIADDAVNAEHIGDLTANLKWTDSQKAVFGAGDDLQLYHSSDQSYITNSTGNLRIDADHLRLRSNTGNEAFLSVSLNGGVELYYDNSKKFETTSYGVSIPNRLNVQTISIEDWDSTNETGALKCGAGNDLQIYHNGTHSYIKNGTGQLAIQVDEFRLLNNAGSENMIDASADGAVKLYYDASNKAETYSNGFKINGQLQCEGDVKFDNPDTAGRDVRWDSSDDTLEFNDNTKAGFGDGLDLQIYHDSNHSYINHNGQGDLYVQTDAGFFVQQYGTTERLINANSNGSVELFYDGTKKFETTSTGCNGPGGWNSPDGQAYRAGTDNDLLIYHDGNSRIVHSGAGDLTLQSNKIWLGNAGLTEVYLEATNNGAVEIKHDNVKKFETTSTGVAVTGTCDATCFTGDSGTAYGYTVIADGVDRNVTTSFTQLLAPDGSDPGHEWNLPAAGVYKLQAIARIRVWDENGYVAARCSGNAGDGAVQMGFESGEAEGDFNACFHGLWVYTATGADDVELQFKSSTSNSGTSIQNDINGRTILYWERIG